MYGTVGSILMGVSQCFLLRECILTSLRIFKRFNGPRCRVLQLYYADSGAFITTPVPSLGCTAALIVFYGETYLPIFLPRNQNRAIRPLGIKQKLHVANYQHLRPIHSECKEIWLFETKLTIRYVNNSKTPPISMYLVLTRS